MIISYVLVALVNRPQAITVDVAETAPKERRPHLALDVDPA
jgi:hypothetical protein